MSYNPYENVSIDNPLPCKEVDGTYTSGEDVSEANPFPVMVVDADAYTKFEDVSEDNPQPITLDTGATYTRFEDLSDTNRKPVVIVEGQHYDPKQPISMTNPWPVIDASPAPSYTGPLDLVPGAVVAYGVRALSAAWLGQNIFRLRRDSDDAEMDFAADAVTGDAPMAEITTWLSGANGYFVTLYDQSGNSKDAAQADTAHQALYSASGPNSKPQLDTAPPHNHAFLATATAVTFPSGAYTVMAVINVPSTGVGDICGYGSDGGGNNWIQVAGAGVPTSILFVLSSDDGWTNDSEGGQTAGALLLDEASILDCSWNLGNTSIKQNGTELFTNPADSYDSGAVGSISKEFLVCASDITHPGYGGKICELIAYSSLQSSPNRIAIDENMATYYGITLS